MKFIFCVILLFTTCLVLVNCLLWKNIITLYSSSPRQFSIKNTVKRLLGKNLSGQRKSLFCIMSKDENSKGNNKKGSGDDGKSLFNNAICDFFDQIRTLLFPPEKPQFKLNSSWIANFFTLNKITSTKRDYQKYSLWEISTGTILIGTLFLFVRKGTRRFKTALDIPNSWIVRQKKLHGIALFVNDTDNVRFFHTPFLHRFFLRSNPHITKSEYKTETINVRLAGIDAPELGHFGTVAQPYSAEAREWLRKTVEGRRVTIKLHRLDQYHRIVASVWMYRFWFFPVNIPLKMIKAGYATVYEGSGAEYNGTLSTLRYHEQIAKSKRRGMWIQLARGTYTSPAQHKRESKKYAE